MCRSLTYELAMFLRGAISIESATGLEIAKLGYVKLEKQSPNRSLQSRKQQGLTLGRVSGFLAILVLGLVPAGADITDYALRGRVQPTVYVLNTHRVENSQCRNEEQVAFKLEPTSHAHASKFIRVPQTICRSAYNDCNLQGSCRLVVQNIRFSINVARMEGGVRTFQLIDTRLCPYGYGGGNYNGQTICIDPYYSVAADLSVHPLGTVIYVPAMRGVQMADGRKHHGHFIVRDKGGGVKGPNRFDFAIGFASPNDPQDPFFNSRLRDPNTRWEYYVVSGETAQAYRDHQKFPGIR